MNSQHLFDDDYRSLRHVIPDLCQNVPYRKADLTDFLRFLMGINISRPYLNRFLPGVDDKIYHSEIHLKLGKTEE